MQALVKYHKGYGNVKLMEMPEPVCASNQVLLKVHACGICGTDLHVYHDTFRNFPPVILGHEFAGTIVEKGKDVNGVEIGDSFAVLGATAVTCKTCAYCNNGQFMFCSNRRGMGHGVNGAFAEYVAVRPDQLFPLKNGLTLRHGALIEPLAVAVHAVCEMSGVGFGDVVLLSGPGPIGLLCLKLLAAQGIKTIVAGMSADELRLQKALEYGATRVIKVDKEDLVEIIKDETSGAGADLAIECAGVEASVRNCLQSLRPLGRYVQVGHFGVDIRIPWDLVAFRQLKITGSVGYTRDTWLQTLKILEQGKLYLDDVITHELPLNEWENGFELSEHKNAVKVLLYPDRNNIQQ